MDSSNKLTSETVNTQSDDCISGSAIDSNKQPVSLATAKIVEHDSAISLTTSNANSSIQNNTINNTAATVSTFCASSSSSSVATTCTNSISNLDSSFSSRTCEITSESSNLPINTTLGATGLPIVSNTLLANNANVVSNRSHNQIDSVLPVTNPVICSSSTNSIQSNVANENLNATAPIASSQFSQPLQVNQSQITAPTVLTNVPCVVSANSNLGNNNNNTNVMINALPVTTSTPTPAHVPATLPVAATVPLTSNTTTVTGNVNSSTANNLEMGDDDSEDESEILEESPCGRWLKRREEVEQRDIPGIDATFLAMDTEEGVEVVWNEVRFSERKYFSSKEENICEVFDRLILLSHPNIVKLHKYWMDKDVEKPRVIFITEYMSSGSLKLFLKKTKKNDVKMSLGAWKRWCTQILSALCYLHSARPAIIHENLTCDTIFISHNGLIKIGAVAPNAIHQHIKTVADDTMSNIYLVAPEIANMTGDIAEVLTPAVDIYSFGMCALEMAALEITGNGESSQITQESIEKTLESLDNELQKDFIRQCIQENPAQRPTAKQLLFHPVIFEVPSLSLFAAHALLNNNPTYQLTDEALQKSYHKLPPETILAEITHADGRSSVQRRVCDMPRNELEKFFDEVRNGAYPLTAIMPTTKPPIISRQRTISPVQSGDRNDKPNAVQENPYNEENRKIVNMMCNIKAQQENENLMMLTLLLRLDDKMNRQLSCEITDIESPICLANELVYYGFINQTDRDMVAALINDTISRTHYNKSENPASVTLHQSTMTTV